MKKKLREVIQRVEFWPEERQESAAKVLLQMETQARTLHRLTDDQAAEVERRVADTQPQFLSQREARLKLAKRKA